VVRGLDFKQQQWREKQHQGHLRVTHSSQNNTQSDPSNATILLATALNKRNDPTTHVPPISPFEEFTFK
jgi:hypothetical protein